MSRPRQLPPGVARVPGVGGFRYRGRVRMRGQTLSATFDDPNEAGAWAQDTKARLRRGEAPAPIASMSAAPTGRDVTVQAAAEHFFRSIVAGTVRGRRGQPYTPGTLVAYESAFRRCLLPELGPRPLDTISRRELRQLFDHLAAVAGASTIYAAKAALKAIYCLAERDGLYEGTNPCEGISNQQTSVQRRGRALSKFEQRRLLEAAQEHDRDSGRSLMVPLVRLLLSTGLRIGEAVALRYDPLDSLDLDRERLRVSQIVGMGLTDETPSRPRLMLCDRTKTPSSRATIQLGKVTVHALRKHRQAVGANDGDLVFSGWAGQLLYPSRWPLDHAWADVKRRSGLEPPVLHLHDLRHTFGSTLIEMGERLPTVARRMRHKSPEVTLRIYTHELGDDAARDRYDDWLESDDVA